MNIHKNARLTLARRIELVRMIIDQGFMQAAAARELGVSEPTVRKWLGRYLAEGESGLRDRSSRPKDSPRAIAPQKALAIVELRRRRLTQARIAASVGVSPSTVSRVWRGPGFRACAIWSLPSLWCATSMRTPVTWYTSIRRSLGASNSSAIALPAIAAIAHAVPAGNSCSWRSTTIAVSASPISIPTSASPAPYNFLKTQSLTSDPSASACAAF